MKKSIITGLLAITNACAENDTIIYRENFPDAEISSTENSSDEIENINNDLKAKLKTIIRVTNRTLGNEISETELCSEGFQPIVTELDGSIYKFNKIISRQENNGEISSIIEYQFSTNENTPNFPNCTPSITIPFFYTNEGVIFTRHACNKDLDGSYEAVSNEIGEIQTNGNCLKIEFN